MNDVTSKGVIRIFKKLHSVNDTVDSKRQNFSKMSAMACTPRSQNQKEGLWLLLKEHIHHGQGWEFAHKLIAHSLICSDCSDHSYQMNNCERFTQIYQDKWATVRPSLDRSCQKCDRERFAQVRVAHVKRVTVSDSLRSGSLMINEGISESLVFCWANRSLALSLTKKQSAQKLLIKIVFFGTFFVSLKKPEWFANCLFFNERCKQIAQVAHQKWANRSGCSPKMSDHEQIT